MGNNPLRVKSTVSNTTVSLTLSDFQSICEHRVSMKPQLKSLESLSDEDWLFVFGREELSNRTINKWGNEYIEHKSDGYLYNEYNTRLNEFKHCDQGVLNRLHSLHRSENEKELLKAGLVEVVDG
jgi:hypothetical protein